MGIREEKNRQAESYIRNLAVNLNPGEALPPLRQMIRESGLGRNVLENAIRKLEAGRVLETRKRSGIYLAESVKTAPPEELPGQIIDIVACSEIGYLATSDARVFAVALLNGLLAGAVRRKLVPRIHRISFYDPVESYAALIEKHQIRQALLVMPHHNDIRRTFEARGIPHMLVLPRYYPSYGPAVIDAPELVELQVKHLFAFGHRRIGFIHTVDLGLMWITDLLRRECFYRVMSENGIAVRPEWVIHYSLQKEQLFERLDRMFASSQPPTALVVSDWFLRDVYDYLRQRGMAIGPDCSVISSDGLEGGDLTPVPASVVNSPEKMAQLAWQLFDRHLADNQFRTIDYIDLELREGHSVAKVDTVARINPLNRSLIDEDYRNVLG